MVIFDIEHENTNSAYFGWTAGQDHIKILKSGWYRVTANVLAQEGQVGEKAFWELEHRNSVGALVDHICQNFGSFGDFAYQNSCGAPEFFNKNDRVYLEDNSDESNIFGSPSNSVFKEGHFACLSLDLHSTKITVSSFAAITSICFDCPLFMPNGR